MELEACKEENVILRKCCLVMALRLLGEDPESFGPACRAVMAVWGKKASDLVEGKRDGEREQAERLLGEGECDEHRCE